MKNKNLFAYTLLGLGALMLLNNPFTGGFTWFWFAVMAAFAYWEYKQRKNNHLLLASTSLIGLAAGLLLEQILGIAGLVLIAIALSLVSYKRRSGDSAKYLDYLIIGFGAFGLLTVISSLTFISSSWFALCLVALGLVLIFKKPKTLTLIINTSEHTNTETNEEIKDIKEELGKIKKKEKSKTVNKETIVDIEETKAKASTKSKTKTKIDSQQEMIEIAEKLVEKGSKPALSKRLKSWRKSKAKELGYKESAIISDASLAQILKLKPQNEKELLAIKGIGKVKLKRYGKEILELVSQ